MVPQREKADKMYAYQINVALPAGETFDGKPAFAHFFRTDWIVDVKQAKAVAQSLQVRFDGAAVTLVRKSLIAETVTF